MPTEVNFDPGQGGGDVIVIANSSEGSTESTGVVTGTYGGHQSNIISQHATVTKVGPIMVPYDPFIASILSGEF